MIYLTGEEREMLWNRETGVISFVGDALNEFEGTKEEFAQIYETVNVTLKETKDGFFLEGTSTKGDPVHAKLTEKEYFSGKEFVSEFDKNRKKEEVRELYSKVFHASNYKQFSHLAEEYTELISSIKKGKLLSMEDVKNVEKEVEYSFDRNRKIEQVREFYSEIIYAANDVVMTNLEEDYAQIVESAVKNQLLSREDIEVIENELNREHQLEQIRESCIRAFSNGKDFSVVLDAVREDGVLSEEEIMMITEDIQHDIYIHELHTEFERHEVELLQVIDEEVEKDKQGKSYIDREELEELLGNHFLEVEKLLATHFEPQPHSDFVKKAKQLPVKLKEMRTGLANQITATINLTKDIADEKVNQLRDNVDDVVRGAKNFIKHGILNVNARVQKLTSSVERKLTIEDNKELGTIKETSKNKAVKSTKNMER